MISYSTRTPDSTMYHYILLLLTLFNPLTGKIVFQIKITRQFTNFSHFIYPFIPASSDIIYVLWLKKDQKNIELITVGARQCFQCLNGEYSGPEESLLSLNKCGDFDPADENITGDCLRTERCYIASLNGTL